MHRLLTAYRADPTAALAEKIYQYSIKHPFAACLLLPDDTAVLTEAIKHSGRAEAQAYAAERYVYSGGSR